MSGPAIPQFHLYGESESFADPGFVHIETIESRSRRNDWEISPHRHQRMDQLLILRSGGVTVRIDAAEEWREGPLAIYVPAMTVHGFVFDAEVDGDVLSFSADLGRSVLPAHYPAPLFPGQPLVQPLDPQQIAAINPLLEQLGLECSGHDSGRIAAASWIVALILLQVERARVASGGGEAAALESARQQRFRALVDGHFAEQLPISFYAARMGVTEKTLTRMCRSRFGCSPKQYLHRRLLLEAQRLLIYGSATVAQIADDLGFADPSYFTRFYRRMTGRLPSEHRGVDASRT
jgi:AraC family transcriptional activator of pobA